MWVDIGTMLKGVGRRMMMREDNNQNKTKEKRL
jgi:hypothetical protein